MSTSPPRRLSPLTPVARAPLLVVAFVGGSWQTLLQQRDAGITALVLLGLLVAGTVYGVASWLRTKYWIDGRELRIDTGVLVRQSRRIRIDRLQGIDIVQPFVARLLGLAELRFDVASGSDREGSLAFLPHAEARGLRDLLLTRRDEYAGDAPLPGAAPGAPGAASAPERVLARLDLTRLLMSLVLSTESLLLGGLALVLVVSFGVTGSLALVGGLVPAIVALALTAGRRLTAYYGFTLTASPAGLQVHRGLTARSSQTVALHRVQGVVVAEPLLWRPTGWARLEVSVAGYQRSDPNRVEASSTLMPVGPRDEVVALASQVLGADLTRVLATPPPPRARWRSPVGARVSRFGQDQGLVVSGRGWWVRRVDAVPQGRVQSLRVVQGPAQRRLRLADVVVDSPPGPVSVRGRHRDAEEARAELDRAVVLARRARHRRASQPAAATPAPPMSPVTPATPPTAETTQ